MPDGVLLLLLLLLLTARTEVPQTDRLALRVLARFVEMRATCENHVGRSHAPLKETKLKYR